MGAPMPETESAARQSIWKHADRSEDTTPRALSKKKSKKNRGLIRDDGRQGMRLKTERLQRSFEAVFDLEIVRTGLLSNAIGSEKGMVYWASSQGVSR